MTAPRNGPGGSTVRIRTKHSKFNEAGSVVIESTLTLLIAMSMLTGGFFVTYVVFARVWLDREAYEGLVCLGSTSTVTRCEKKLRTETASALPIGDIIELNLSRSQSEAQIHLQYNVSKQIIFKRKQSLTLPLRPETQAHGLAGLLLKKLLRL